MGRMTRAWVLLSLVVVAAPASAQSPASAARVGHRELTIEQQNAFGLLDGLSDQAKALVDESMRIRVEARLADALWDRDRERAKRLYRRAFDEIDDLSESIVDPTAAPVGARSELYVELFGSLYRLDPSFANELARGLDDDPDLYDGDSMPFESLSDRSATMLGVATSLASRNPTLAVELGRQCLANGVPLEFGNLLTAVGMTDRRAADALAGEALQVSMQSASGPIDLWGVGSYLFPDLQVGPATAADPGGEADLKRRYLETAYAVTGRFVTGLTDVSARGQADATDPSSVYAGQGLVMSYGFVRRLSPLFDSFDPDRATAFRVLVGQIEGAGPTDLRERIGSTTPLSESPDAIAARAADATDAGVRASLYSRAAFAALQRDGYDAAKSYVAKIDDSTARARVLGSLARAAVADAVGAGRFDDARRYAADVPALDERASVYCDVARSLASAGKRAGALDTLDDAERLLAKDGSVMTDAKARALVRVANVYAGLDPMRGFDVMNGALDSVNKALAAAADAGSTKGRNPGTMFVLSTYDPSSGLEELARADYFRALGLAQSLDSKPLAILAQLAVIRGAIRPTATVRPPAKPAPRPTPAKKPKKAPAAACPAPTAKP